MKPQDKARAYFEKKFPKEKNTDRWNWVIRFAADFHTEMMAEEKESKKDLIHHIELNIKDLEIEKLTHEKRDDYKGEILCSGGIMSLQLLLKHLTK